jgi:hypothetical protein
MNRRSCRLEKIRHPFGADQNRPRVSVPGSKEVLEISDHIQSGWFQLPENLVIEPSLRLGPN